MYNTEIINLSRDIPQGVTVREVCPSCHGGAQMEKSISITRDEQGIVWQCFRAKCNYKGALRDHTFCMEPRVHTPKRRVWEGVTHELPDSVRAKIAEMWRIVDPPNWYWTTDYGGRVAMSIRSPRDIHRGWILRSLSSHKGGTKALTYVDEGEEGLSWYKTVPGAPTLVVEDIPSAIRASASVNAVALLGTGVGLTRAQEIAAYAPRPVIMALDQDATGLSFKWAKKYKILWDDVRVFPLSKDIKDMDEEEIQCLNKLRD